MRPNAAGTDSNRIPALDVLRGAVMVLMALDHTRDYFSNVRFEPEDLRQTWAALFAVRWVTHFCAPLFFFLAGTGAYFYGLRRTPGELSRFLWTRGVWLIALEFTVVGFAWTFVAPWGVFGVIWALGASMVILAAAVRLPIPWLAALGLATVAGHDLLDGLHPAAFGSWATVWSLLHATGGVSLNGWQAFVLFPLVPWCAVMALGFVFGRLLQRPDAGRWAARIGGAATVLFVLLRASNLYGNPAAVSGGVAPGDWSVQPTLSKTLILFFDTEKYPPSLQFLLMTLGPSLLALAWLRSRQDLRILRPLEIFGRVPLFFYVLHLYLIHALAVLVAVGLGQPYAWLLDGAFWFHDLPAGYGHGLPFVVATWVLVVVALYFPCRWFARIKATRRSVWLSYL